MGLLAGVVVLAAGVMVFLYMHQRAKNNISAQSPPAVSKPAPEKSPPGASHETPSAAEKQEASAPPAPRVPAPANPTARSVLRTSTPSRHQGSLPSGAAADQELQAQALRRLREQQSLQAQQHLQQQAQAIQQERAQVAQQRQMLQQQQQALQREKSQLQAQASPPAPTPPSSPPPAPAPPPPPAYHGPSSGTVVWQGEVHGTELIDISGGQSSQGSVTGTLPGVPCMVQPTDPKHVSIAIAPSPSNGWKRVVVRVKGKGRVTVRLNWSTL